MYDLVVNNTRLIGGSGAPAYDGAVAIRSGKIAAVGQVDDPAREIQDAKAKVPCPGLIDIHTHYDALSGTVLRSGEVYAPALRHQQPVSGMQRDVA